jgi:hypothetical protein
MKNSESFKRELDLLESGASGSTELSRLQTKLRLDASFTARSDQHQTWAWTRLREELKATPSHSLFSWKKYLAPSLAATAVLLLGAYLLTSSRNNLSIESISPDLYAQTFQSGEAEVIWITGYNYIPSSYPIK